MKILIASDIHGRLKRAQRLFDVIKEENPAKIIILGDFLYNGPRNGVPDDYDPMGVAAFFTDEIKSKLIAIRGNCDARIDETVLGLRLEDTLKTKLNGYVCDLTHGDRFDDSLHLNVEEGDILMFGHTHVPMLKRERGRIFLNPGSTSFPKGGSVPSYAIFDESSIEVRPLFGGAPVLSLKLEPQNLR